MRSFYPGSMCFPENNYQAKEFHSDNSLVVFVYVEVLNLTKFLLLLLYEPLFWVTESVKNIIVINERFILPFRLPLPFLEVLCTL